MSVLADCRLLIADTWLLIPGRNTWRGHSSVGRAPALQAGGRRFDPVWLHHTRVERGIFGSSVAKQIRSRRVAPQATRGRVISDIVKR
jgi:hypothetical protein